MTKVAAMTNDTDFQASKDFLKECQSIEALIDAQENLDFAKPTLFKNWTIGDIIGHLHLWNIAADLALTQPDVFRIFAKKVMAAILQGQSHQTVQGGYFAGEFDSKTYGDWRHFYPDRTKGGTLKGQSYLDLEDGYFGGKSDLEVYADWRDFYPDMTARFAASNPERRVKWVGPDMSVRSSIIARQMEHWSHTQAIFDVLGLERVNSDRLKNIVHMGVTTYSWSFRVNGLEPPKRKPYLRLTAPSGTIWEWNDPQEDNRLDGPAEDFAQVVTQCRNIADTALIMTGVTAQKWMEIAQCFAGAAETPPPKGTRFKA